MPLFLFAGKEACSLGITYAAAVDPFRQAHQKTGQLPAFTEQNPFIQKPYQEPDRSIVQSDDTVQMVRGAAVIPGAHISAFKKAAADIFP